jgi:hypothetical protein
MRKQKRLLCLGDKNQYCDLMVKEVDVAELRKRLGIKRLKKKIPTQMQRRKTYCNSENTISAGLRTQKSSRPDHARFVV